MCTLKYTCSIWALGCQCFKIILNFGIIFKGGYRRGIYVLIKTLNQKMSGGKSLYISQGYPFKKKILNQSQKKFGFKKAYFFGGHPNSGSCVQNASTLLQNISTLKKSASSCYYEPR